MTKRFSALLAVGSAMTALFLYASPAAAQATRTWVSGVGDDANPCSRTAPCKTFAGAISKTALNGEINCLDPAGYGTVTITKSITIDCKNTHGSILNSSVNGINIPFDNFTAAGETRKAVRLRGLALNGADTGTIGVRVTGGAAATGTEVFIEDSIIDGNYGGTSRGISDERSGGGKLFVTNTTVRNMRTQGIAVVPALGSSAGALRVMLDNVRVENAQYGVVVGAAGQVMVSRSVLSGSDVGAYVEGTGQINISDSVISNNVTGLQNASATMRLSGNDISLNDTGISGSTLSHGNNRIQGNASAGTVPTLLSPALQ